MGLRFTVLASGSSGNASLVEADGFTVLLDAGLGPRQLAARMAAVGTSWASVNAVLLTHTHSDHWKDRTLAYLHRHRIPFYCHPGHHANLLAFAPSFPGLAAAGHVRSYEEGKETTLAPGLRCRPLPVRHDGGPTFGFRLEGKPDLFGQAPSLAYLADLGSWNEELAAALVDVDLLAVEFNHDVAMEWASGRMPALIARVLGDEGHLSNVQAAALVRAVLTRSTAGRLQHLVQLHLSRDCNRPGLARAAVEPILTELASKAGLHTAAQDRPGPALHLGVAANGKRPSGTPRKRLPRTNSLAQNWLPGFEERESG
jgi:ribonuclease BN (tRNA processing enzyme)